jgi:ribonuclease T2
MNVGRGFRVAAALLAFMLAPPLTTAWAQGDSDCILDNCADKKPPKPAGSDESRQPSNEAAATPITPMGGGKATGNFDFFVLSLSWSPGFCATGGAEKAREQCSPGAGLGFVVHGLWPQNTHGFPSNCDAIGRYPSRIALESTKGLYPDEGLARHEWRVHGTCTGESPTDYFADVRRARQAITIPAPFRAPRQAQRWAAIDLERAFIAANPRLRPGMMSVECNRSTLSEVRICMSKDLRNFVACPEVARHFCFGREMTVPPIQ